MATQKKRSAAATRKKQNTQRGAGDVRLRGEILFLVILAFSILLLISHFGLGGFVGRRLSAFFFGIFGFPAYAFPVVFFIGCLFIMSNKQNPRMPRKVLGGTGLYVFLCALFQLLMNGYERNVRIRDYFIDSSYDRMGGGLIGGVITRIFGGLFGTVGAYVLVVAGLIIFAIIMTQEPLLAIMRDKSGKLYQAAAERSTEQRAQAAHRRSDRAARRAQRQAASAEAVEAQTTAKSNLSRENDLAEPAQTIRVRGASDQKQDAVPEEILTALRQELDPELKAEAMHKMTKRFSIWPEDEEGSAEAETAPTPEEGAARVGKKSSAASKRRANKETSDASGTEAAPEQLVIPKEPANQETSFRFPPLSLLREGSKDDRGETTAQLNETAEKLQRVLDDFGVKVQITDVSRGPSVTRYELHPEQGVKVSKILSLQDDIKLNLAAADIRIEAPIPGKAAIGIEVPNHTNSTVTLRDMLTSKQYRQSRAKLAFAVGMDIAGNPIITDIAKMPHLLIAGATGSGKSVCINTLIMSILYRCSPEDVKMIMIDPKMVELSVYNGIPHLYIPVVTDTKKAAGALNWAVTEMSERYNRFAGMGVRDIQGYNDKIAQIPEVEGEERPAKMPRVVIILDELADLMMVSKHEVEDAIIQLSQLARAAGIHLVIATQRPSVDVITGLIKANMPSRIALAVSSGTDSRTILDMNGAEKLIGKGDMLFYPQGYPKPARVQGAFVTDEEIEEVVSFLTEKNEATTYDEKVEEQISTAATITESSTAASDSDRDVYFEEAGRLIIEKDKASIGMLQRAFKIGFNRAARIMDQLCEAGVVGEEEGTKPRRILMDMASFEAVLGEE